MLGLTHHPAVWSELSAPTLSQHRLIKLLSYLVYRCDPADQFRSQREPREFHQNLARQELLATARTVKQARAAVGARPPVLSQATITNAAIFHHFLVRCKTDKAAVFELPAVSWGSMMRLEQFFDTPITAAPPTFNEVPGHRGQPCYFTVVRSEIGRLKTVPLAPAAGRHLALTDVALTVHPVLAHVDAKPVVSVTPARGSHCLAIVSTFQDIPVEALELEFRVWTPSPHILCSFRRGGGGAFQEVSALINDMLVANALPNTGQTYQSRATEDAHLAELATRDYVELFEHPNGWCFTPLGLRELCFGYILDHSTLVCEVRAEVPLQDKTHYELLATLHADGWTWQRLRANQPSFIINDDAPKHYCSRM